MRSAGRGDVGGGERKKETTREEARKEVPGPQNLYCSSRIDDSDDTGGRDGAWSHFAIPRYTVVLVVSASSQRDGNSSRRCVPNGTGAQSDHGLPNDSRYAQAVATRVKAFEIRLRRRRFRGLRKLNCSRRTPPRVVALSQSCTSFYSGNVYNPLFFHPAITTESPYGKY